MSQPVTPAPTRTVPDDTARPALRVIVLLLAVALIVLSAMTVVPPWSMTALIPVVAARELSPIVVLLDVVMAISAHRTLRARSAARPVVVLLLALGAVTAARPMLELPGVIGHADADVRALSRASQDEERGLTVSDALRSIPAGAASDERRIAYRAADGTQLTLRLFRAAGRTVRPAIVVIYGGAWRAGDAGQAADASRGYVARGYTTVAVDYRHAPAHPYPAALEDVRRSLALVRDSAAAWGIDTSRIALLGRSAGGHLAELSAYSPGGPRVAAVVAIYAPHDLVRGYRDIPSPDPIDARAVLRAFMHGTPDDALDRYRAASPSNWVRPGVPPTLLVFGGDDHLVQPEFNRGAARSLHAAGVPVVAVELPWAEHGFDLVPRGIGSRIGFNVTTAFLDRVMPATQ